MAFKKLTVILFSVTVLTWNIPGNNCQAVTSPGTVSQKVLEMVRKDGNGSKGDDNFLWGPVGINSLSKDVNCSEFLEFCCNFLCNKPSLKNDSLYSEGEVEILFTPKGVFERKSAAMTLKNLAAHILPICILMFGISVGLGLYFLAARAIVPVSSSIKA